MVERLFEVRFAPPVFRFLSHFLQKACHNVKESECLVEKLQAEISVLKRQLREKRQNETGTSVFLKCSSKSDLIVKKEKNSCVCLLAASDEDPPEQKNNLMLHKVFRTLFAHAPIFHTQTLDFEGHPVPETCCCYMQNKIEGSATVVEHTDTTEDPESLSLLSPRRTKPKRRLLEPVVGRERKRRKSSS